MLLPLEKATSLSQPERVVTVVETLWGPDKLVRVRDDAGVVWDHPEADLYPVSQPDTIEEHPQESREDTLLRRDVEDLIPNIQNQNLNGHSVYSSYREANLFKYCRLSRLHVPISNVRLLKEAIDKGIPCDRWISFTCLSIQKCNHCGAYPQGETNGLEIRFKSSCPAPNGVYPCVTKLNVPSGRLVIENDLRELFPNPDHFDVNTDWGLVETTKSYAEIGLAHGFVGNTCPGFYLGAGRKSTYHIGTVSTEYWDGKGYRKRRVRSLGTRLAGICTDLWWYSICDADEFVRRGGNLSNVTVVDLKPGVYQITQNARVECEKNNPSVYATFKWLGKPKPWQDLNARYQNMNVTPYDFITWYNATYRGTRKDWAAPMNHALCVIGNGMDWHEQGFPLVPALHQSFQHEVPMFREKLSWYPLCDFSYVDKATHAETPISDEWVKVCFNILQNIISFGDASNLREGQSVFALSCYRRLVKRFPHLVDETYLRWVEDGDRADLWIQKLSRNGP